MILKENEELVTEFEVGDVVCHIDNYKNGLIYFFTATAYCVKHYSGRKFSKYIRKKDGQISNLI
jgi:hypothetical protein